MDAISLLKKHHRKAEAALKKLCRGFDRETLDEVADELAAHMVIEEQTFYPAMRRVRPDLVLESYEEHAVAQLELKRLLACDPDDARFEARAAALLDLVKHHVEEEEDELVRRATEIIGEARAAALLDLVKHHVEEEEDELFPRVEKTIDEDVLDRLGAEMKETFEELVERGHDAVLGRGAAATVTGDRQSKRIASEAMSAR